MTRLGASLLTGLILVGIASCARTAINARLEAYPAPDAYRFPEMDASRRDPADELFVCLSFSGGGTRAAAFAYGALLKLRETRIGRGGAGPTLLDEVDCIAGISGGAFTAAYYGAFRPTFERFYDDFLARDIQAELAWRTANPARLLHLLSPYYSRSDIAAELYDDTVFRGKRFADLPRRPFVILHATSMANGARFEFTQDQFDFLRSDLRALPLAQAVAASSAFPFLLTPVTLRSFPSPPEFRVPDDYTRALGDRDLDPARYLWARHRLDALAPDGKWVHLLDGGLADNIGLRGILEASDTERGFILPRLNAGRIKRLVVIAINARTDPPEHLSRQARTPGTGEVFAKTATVSMGNFSVETLGLARSRHEAREQAQTDILICNKALRACGGTPFPELAGSVRTCFIEIDFEGLPPGRREAFLSLPTTFALPRAQVDDLIMAASELLDSSPDFTRLVGALRGEPSLGAGVGADRGNCS